VPLATPPALRADGPIALLLLVLLLLLVAVLDGGNGGSVGGGVGVGDGSGGGRRRLLFRISIGHKRYPGMLLVNLPSWRRRRRR